MGTISVYTSDTGEDNLIMLILDSKVFSFTDSGFIPSNFRESYIVRYYSKIDPSSETFEIYSNEFLLYLEETLKEIREGEGTPVELYVMKEQVNNPPFAVTMHGGDVYKIYRTGECMKMGYGKQFIDKWFDALPLESRHFPHFSKIFRAVLLHGNLIKKSSVIGN